jgi:excisionase family DNA binding protein
MLEKQLLNELKYLRESIDLRFDTLEQELCSLKIRINQLEPPSPPAPLNETEFLRTKEACLLLGIAESTLAKYLSEGKIKAYKLGSKLNQYKRADLIEFQRNYLRKAN